MKADNKTKTLKTDPNAELIFKKGDYIHTYVVIETSGLPNGATLYLLDENLNQLYSPYDINANQIKTPCTIIVGETDALQLPANYIDDEYTDFDVGTYHWNLKYHDIMRKTFEDKIIPVTIKIQDFDLETNLTPKIFPNQDIQIQLKTWVNTNPQINNVDTDRLTTNASYDGSTGIITYPNSDINDLSIGKHMQVINQANNYFIDYEVKNPFEIRYVSESREYSTSNQYILLASFQVAYRELDQRYIHAVETAPDIRINDVSFPTLSSWGHSNGDGYIYAGTNFPPGTYNIEATAKNRLNHLYYTATKTMIVTTENCSITLTLDYNENSYQPAILQNINPVNGAQDYSYNSQDGILDVSGTNANNLQSTDIYINLASFNGGYMLIQCLSEGVKFIAHDKGTNEATANFHQLGNFEYLQSYNISIDNNIATINKDNTDENIIIDLTAQEFGFVFPSTDNLYVKILQREKTASSLIATYLYNEIPIPNASIQILKDNVVIDTLTTDSNGQCTVAIQIGSTYKAQAVDYDNSILLESNNLLTQ